MIFAVSFVLVVLAACGVAILQLFRGLDRSRAFVASMVLMGAVVGLPGLLFSRALTESDQPLSLVDTSYKTSSSCKKCHAPQYESWYRTYHRTMTQDALPENVLGDFEDVTVRLQGYQCRLFREGDRFLMDLVDPIWERQWLDGDRPVTEQASAPRVVYEVNRLTGSHNAQIYLSQSPNGTYLTLPLVWYRGEKKWINLGANFLAPEQKGLFDLTTAWNNNCIFCHNTKPNPGWVPGPNNPNRNPLWNTRAEELGIACEACHGPGESHAFENSNPARRYFLNHTERNDPTIINPAKLSQSRSVLVCGRCHGKWKPNEQIAYKIITEGELFLPGMPGGVVDQLFWMPFPKGRRSHRTEEVNLYWPDWSPRTNGMEYQGVLLSPCYEKGEMTCLSCHSMHDSDPDDQLIIPDDPAITVHQANQSCTQCHGKYDTPESRSAHSHHPSDSSGSRCYNCHMPYQVYGLLKGVRSHRISNPDAALSAETRLPNACNQCHVDQSLAWTAQWLHQWYGHAVPPLSEDDKVLSSNVVDLLQGHALNRALAAASFARAADPATKQTIPGENGVVRWSVPFLALALDDDYPAVRQQAYLALRKLHGFEDLSFDFLDDAEDRAEAINEVRRRWENREDSPFTDLLPRVPLTTEREPIDNLVKRLIKERDRTRIFLKE